VTQFTPRHSQAAKVRTPDGAVRSKKQQSTINNQSGEIMKSMKVLVGACALLLAGAAQAQTCQNTCVGDVKGPREGRQMGDSTADAVLWPPNHKLRSVSIAASNAKGKSCNVTITRVSQDEPATGDESMGSGNTYPDAAGCTNSGNTSYVQLRGERTGIPTTTGADGFTAGRYYHVDYTMEDPDCATGTASDEAKILVPHDQGKAHVNSMTDEGALFESGAVCTP
jgi:hypothetical protein